MHSTRTAIFIEVWTVYSRIGFAVSNKLAVLLGIDSIADRGWNVSVENCKSTISSKLIKLMAAGNFSGFGNPNG